MAAGLADDPEVVNRVTATMALRKIAQPKDVAAAIVYLLSDRLSGHISGAVLPVAGGMEGRLVHP
jgi:3-oxoacyl-[acyl-carrier protein] reductase